MKLSPLHTRTVAHLAGKPVQSSSRRRWQSNTTGLGSSSQASGSSPLATEYSRRSTYRPSVIRRSDIESSQHIVAGEAYQSALSNADLLSKGRNKWSTTPRRPPNHDAREVGNQRAPGPSSAADRSAKRPHIVAQIRAPVLKTNPYVDIYGIDELDFEDDVVDHRQVLNDISDREVDDTVGNEGSGTPRANKGDTGSPVNNRTWTWRLSGNESIQKFPGYILYERTRRRPNSKTFSAVITYARLRDACSCEECKHPTTRQKTRTSGQAKLEVQLGIGSRYRPKITLYKHEISGDVLGIAVQWPAHSPDSEAFAETPPHRSYYTWEDIRALVMRQDPFRVYLEKELKRSLWAGSSLAHNSTQLRTSYNDLVSGENSQPSPAVLLEVLKQLHTLGIAIIENVPTVATGDKDCTLRTVANWIGELRNTFYGETWDVKSVQNSKNVAYTSLNLGLHADLLYFSSPPRFQLLHCLRNRVNGGSSYFVDAFYVLHQLMERHPDIIEVLKSIPIPYEYDNDGHYLRHSHPVISSEFSSARNLKAAINWSPPFQAPLGPIQDLLVNPTKIELAQAINKERTLYRALKIFDDNLNAPYNRYEFTMKEGDLVLFDNRRILHARTAFSDKTEEERKRDGTVLIEGEPTRWLKGCYLDGEVVWDKLVGLDRALNESKA